MERMAEAPGAAKSPFLVADGFVAHPYLRPRSVEARDFQLRLAEQCLQRNTLVVVPTGLGKTIVAVLAIVETLRARPGTVLFLAPTRPLAVQHFETMQRLLRDEGLIHLFSGSVPPKRRAADWGKGILVVATPQTIQNDLEAGRYDLARVSLVVFDEAHRAVGDYAYVSIGTRLRFENPKARILGLTASPGARRQRIEDVSQNLGVEAIEAREAESLDVSAYVQPVQLETRTVELTPTLRRLSRPFHQLMAEKEQTLRKLGLVKGPRPYGLTKRELVALQQALGRQAGRGGGFVFGALHAAQLAHYALLCIEYLETQSAESLKRYLDRFQARADLSRNEKSFLNHAATRQAIELLSLPLESPHPKMEELGRVLHATFEARPQALALVFTQYRDNVTSLVGFLRARGVDARRLVGQQSREGEEGMSQDEQRAALDDFRNRRFRTLVSTSIGEEGIDVPQVDLVVFYEPVPSEIRSIQRRGRTGRTLAGRVVVLVARGTLDEGSLKASQRKEAQMRKLVRRLV